MRFLLITGLSGAGKTIALRYMEDAGALCIDNLPPKMMLKFMEACSTTTRSNSLVVMVVDARSGEFFSAREVCAVIDEVRGIGYQIDTVFIEASDDVLISRYKETRRDHPLVGEAGSLVNAIAKEREMLQPLRETANHVIETSALSAKYMHKALSQIALNQDDTHGIRVEVMSFGFKRGLPRQGDLVFDVRFLPNPFYIPSLSRHTGLDESVRDFVMKHPTTIAFMQHIYSMLDFLLPNYQEEGKRHLVIAIGCTGGAHRSVAIAEAITAHLKQQEYRVDINHRDIALEQAHWKTLTGE